MSETSSGLVSELLLVRMHGRADAYLAAGRDERKVIVEACRREATVSDLSERILARTIYAQSASRLAPLRELLQNAIDASRRGGRIDVRASDDGLELTVLDRGAGMTLPMILSDLLVPFRSHKLGDAEAIGEHGVGFFSVLELSPRVELTTSTGRSGHGLLIEPIGEGPPYRDFVWTLSQLVEASPRATGTFVRLTLARPLAKDAVASEVALFAGLVDPELLRIFVNDVPVNTARGGLRLEARAAVGEGEASMGELDLYVGHGEGLEPALIVVQGGLRVAVRHEPFLGPQLALHRDLARAIFATGAGIVVELPLAVPLNKGRSGVCASASREVEAAIVTAFERFVLEDALHRRELLRGVDHRLASVLDRLVDSAIANEETAMTEELARSVSSASATGDPAEVARTPTVAAPEEVVRFAAALIDAPMFTVTTYDDVLLERRRRASLREVLASARDRQLSRLGEPPRVGRLYLDGADPLSEALARRLIEAQRDVALPSALVTVTQERRLVPMPRITRSALLGHARSTPGVRTLGAAMTLLERIDGVIALSAGLTPSPISVHQDLYGPDEMAHTDGIAISVNVASPRVRALLLAVLLSDDTVAFSAIVDLLLHEKSHVSLASHVPRAAAEHGASFYRRKDLLRRKLIEAIASERVIDPMRWVASLRRSLDGPTLPDPDELARIFGSSSLAA